MTEIAVTGHLHDFASKGSAEIAVAVVDCRGCDRQCGITGLYTKDAVISLDDDGVQRLLSGEASTNLYETGTVEGFMDTDLDSMTHHILELGSIPGAIPISELTEFTIDTVSRLHQDGRCLIELANGQSE